MASASMIVLCASALFVQSMAQLCQPAAAPAPWAGCGAPSSAPVWAPAAAPGCGAYGNIVSSGIATANGGGFGVTSTSPIAPSGISVTSENTISGQLEASGNLPLLAAVGIDAVLPTGGSAGTTYSCGNGEVGISGDSLSAAGVNGAGYAGAAYGFAPAAFAPNFAAPAAFAGAPAAPIRTPCGCQ